LSEILQQTGGVVADPLPSLCEYISKEDDQRPDNDGSTPSFHRPFTVLDGKVSWLDTPGRLAKSENDIEDNWIIDLTVPCFSGNCAQDDLVPPEYQLDPRLEHKVFGCNLWVEVRGVSEQVEPGTVTVTKVIDPLGVDPILLVTDFNLFVGAEGVVSGVGENFSAGSYVVSETEVDPPLDVPYTSDISCDDDDFNAATDTITVEPGEVISCTITNTEAD
jgi:hypothetical protein